MGWGGLKERQDKMEHDIEEIKKEIDEIRRSKVVDKVSFAEALKKDIAQEILDRDKGSGEAGSVKVDREFQVQLNEAMERDKRRKNVVIMGLVEDDNLVKTQGFISKMLEGLAKEEVGFEVLGRVGKVSGDRARPVRVCVEDTNVRRIILKNAALLKSDKLYEKVYISPDLTRMQQGDDKKLRDLVKQYRGQGMMGVKISRGDIVREDSTGRVVLHSSQK